MPRKSTGRKQGNQGHFHGEPLALLESYAQAYVDAGMNKTLFWKDFWPDWYKNYPPLSPETTSSSNDASASASVPENNEAPVSAPATNDSLGEPASTMDPDVLNARGTSQQKIKSWFSNRATKFKNREKNPFLYYLRRLDKKLVPPRLTPIHKFFMQLPEYSAEVDAQYRLQFINKGGSSKVDEENEDEEVDQLDDSEKEEEEKEKEEEKDDDDGEGAVVDEEKALALSRRVHIASTLFASKPKEVKEEVARLRQADYEERKKKYEASLSGDDLFDEALVPERRNYIAALTQPFLDALAKMTNTKVSLNVAALEDTPERKDNLFARHIQSNNVAKKFSDWGPDSFRDQYVKSFISYVQAMTELEKATSVSQSVPPASTVDNLLQNTDLLKLDDEELRAGDSTQKGKKRGRDPLESVSTSGRRSKRRKGKGKGKARQREDSSSESAMSSPESGESEEEEPLILLRRFTRGRNQKPQSSSMEKTTSSLKNTTPSTEPTATAKTSSPTTQPQPQLNIEEDLATLSVEDREKHLARYGGFNPYWYNIVRRNDHQEKYLSSKDSRDTPQKL
ncbi:hypothetical protein EV360DRAFT_89483 [Lentinula raphanica]|nr:hypothetical protein EV360DRAFT_89483 [Lentinula raphanica]